jgi:hypothetical protein
MIKTSLDKSNLLLSKPKKASSDLQKSIYNYLYKMYPTPVTPEEMLKNCENIENTKIEDIWHELDSGPLQKVIRYKGRCKYVLNEKRK